MEKLLDLRRKAGSIAELCGLLHAAVSDEATMQLQLSVQANGLQLAIPLPMASAEAQSIIWSELKRLSDELELVIEHVRKLAFPTAIQPASPPPAPSTTVMWYEQQAGGQGGL